MMRASSRKDSTPCPNAAASRLERARADRLRLVVVLQLRRRDQGRLRAQRGDEVARGLLQLEDDRVLVRRLDARDVVEAVREGALRVLHVALDRELHVGRGELAAIERRDVLVLHARLELEGHRLAAVGVLERLDHVRRDPLHRGRVVEVLQCGEEETRVHEADALGDRVDVRVQRLQRDRVTRLDEDERLAHLRLLARDRGRQAAGLARADDAAVRPGRAGAHLQPRCGARHARARTHHRRARGATDRYRPRQYAR